MAGFPPTWGQAGTVLGCAPPAGACGLPPGRIVISPLCTGHCIGLAMCLASARLCSCVRGRRGTSNQQPAEHTHLQSCCCCCCEIALWQAVLLRLTERMLGRPSRTGCVAGSRESFGRWFPAVFELSARAGGQLCLCCCGCIQHPWVWVLLFPQQLAFIGWVAYAPL
jgi:hypothetical protein